MKSRRLKGLAGRREICYDEFMKEQARVEQWKRAGRVIEETRAEEIRKADTAQAMRALTGSVLAELQRRPAEPTSGLVEQQRWFRKLR